MASFEQTIIIGNVGNIQDMRKAGDASVMSFSVAVNWTQKKGDEKVTHTNWYKVTAWRKLAEICAKYIVKGMAVQVIGRVTSSAYLDQEGNLRSSLELTADNVLFLSQMESQPEAEEPAQDMPF